MGLCVNCGAPQNVSKLQCDFCGTGTIGNTVESYEFFITSFTKKMQIVLSSESEEIESIFKSSSKSELTVTAALIDSIYVPAEKNHLVQLVAFLVGQLNSSSHNLDIFNLERRKSLISAWIGKSQEVSTKIELMALNDSQLRAAQDLMEKSLEGAKKKLLKAKKSLTLFYSVLFFFLLIVVPTFLVVMNK